MARDTTRSAATRAALESVVFAPPSVRIDGRGAPVTVERRFGGLLVPSDLTVGWWFDTPRYAPFFKAHIERSTQY